MNDVNIKNNYNCKDADESGQINSNLIDLYDIRRQALAMIASQLSSDAAECNSRFAVVLSNMSVMQVQLVDLLEQTSNDLITHSNIGSSGGGGVGSSEIKELFAPVQSTFVLNNLYYVLQTIRSTALLVDGVYDNNEDINN